MTNPDNTVGTNAGYDGRTTPNAFNDILGTFSRGVISGWACTPKSGMTVQLGGDGSTRDVAIAEDNAGNKTTINNRTATPVEITLAGAPATGNRIDSIVAYVDSAQSGQGATDVDFPSITGIIAVSGTAAGTPSAPTEAQIRSAITSDGADGASSFYVVLANITVGQGVTTIGSGVISAGTPAQMWAGHLLDASVGSDKLTAQAVWTNNINWNTIVGTISDTALTDGYMDFGPVRVQWMNRQRTGLNTAAGTYNIWTQALPASFKNANYAFTVSLISDTGNVSGDCIKSTAHTATSIDLNYNHTGSIGSSTVNFSVIAIGLKP